MRRVFVICALAFSLLAAEGAVANAGVVSKDSELSSIAAAPAESGASVENSSSAAASERAAAPERTTRKSKAATQQTTPAASFTHPWAGARVAFLGDSITDPGISQEAHDWTGKPNDHYWGYLQEMLGIQPYVYGVSGRKWDDVPNQARQLQSEHGDEVDAITIFLGTNDFIDNVPLGEWYEKTMQTTTQAMGYPAREMTTLAHTPALTTKTLRGRINIAISTLKAMYPSKQIVILTPIHRAFSTFGPENIQPEESFPNTIGIYFIEYVQAIKEAANVWGVPVIDLNSLCGINPMVEEQVQYFASPERDRLHPNGLGHKRMALTLYYQFAALPCRF